VYKTVCHHFQIVGTRGMDEFTILAIMEFISQSVIRFLKQLIDLRSNSPNDGMFKFTNISLTLFQVGKFYNLLKLFYKQQLGKSCRSVLHVIGTCSMVILGSCYENALPWCKSIQLLPFISPL
jgi:hypothetical protein